MTAFSPLMVTLSVVRCPLPFTLLLYSPSAACVRRSECGGAKDCDGPASTAIPQKFMCVMRRGMGIEKSGSAVFGGICERLKSLLDF
jgi:hypothetical protein